MAITFEDNKPMKRAILDPSAHETCTPIGDFDFVVMGATSDGRIYKDWGWGGDSKCNPIYPSDPIPSSGQNDPSEDQAPTPLQKRGQSWSVARISSLAVYPLDLSWCC
jgi:hypothetical protein